MRPCNHQESPKPEECRVCWLYVNDARYQALYDGMPPVATPQTLECVHLGEVIDNRGCDCMWKWIHECDVFGSCTRGDQGTNLKVCASCQRYATA